jgi:acyl-CoA synthetase (AMP-forming)/AMP-acid ligase II
MTDILIKGIFRIVDRKKDMIITGRFNIYPREAEFRKSLPKSAVGKILRKIMRDEEITRKNK